MDRSVDPRWTSPRWRVELLRDASFMQDLVRQELAATARLIVVKVGTRVLTRDDGTLNTEQIQRLAEQIQSLRESQEQCF